MIKFGTNCVKQSKFHNKKEAIDINGIIIENILASNKPVLEEKVLITWLGYIFHSDECIKLLLIKLPKLSIIFNTNYQ